MLYPFDIYGEADVRSNQNHKVGRLMDSQWYNNGIVIQGFNQSPGFYVPGLVQNYIGLA